MRKLKTFYGGFFLQNYNYQQYFRRGNDCLIILNPYCRYVQILRDSALNRPIHSFSNWEGNEYAFLLLSEF